MFRNQSVSTHQFAMIPKAEIPRSRFVIQHTHKTAFDAGLLIPIYVDEVLPGDTFNLRMTAFGRLATPIFPIMDNLYLDSFFFFVPNRLVWDNWQKFMGEQENPGDSISYTIPQCIFDTPYNVSSIFDYMGLPCAGQMTPATLFGHSALPLRAYNLIWNEWFRDQNLQDSVPVLKDDGPENPPDYTLLRRGKRHDYFTACLPWTQKGGASVPIPLGTTAPIIGIGFGPTTAGAGPIANIKETGGGTVTYPYATANANLATGVSINQNPSDGFPLIFADLSDATAATVNQLRQSFQVQKLLERDARGGTRYTEIVRSHFGVISPDARLQRPEYLGGGTSPINISPIPQTSSTDATTPQGNLAAMGTTVAQGHGFSQSFTEHGIIIGLVSVRSDLTYQQGLRRMWSRQTRYDFYFPVFAMLGEQAVLNREIYMDGTAADSDVFGYQERWAEYRYNPSKITGLFRSTAAGTIDNWHLAQNFTAVPTLNETFIRDTPPLERILAVGAEANGQQILLDAFFNVTAARPMPMYSVPGLIDHF